MSCIDEDKAKRQLRYLKSRIYSNAKVVMQGEWKGFHCAYKPKDDIADEDGEGWKAECKKQEDLMALISTAIAAEDNGETRYRAILATREMFPKIARKCHFPNAPSSLKMPDSMSKAAQAGQDATDDQHTEDDENVTPDQTTPADQNTTPEQNTASHQNLSSNESSSMPPNKSHKLQEIFVGNTDTDNDDGNGDNDGNVNDEDCADPESEIEQVFPGNQAVKCRPRSAKRRREGDFATQLRMSTDEEDLKFQLREIDLKAQLQQLQVHRKIANLKARSKNKKQTKIKIEKDD